MGERKRRVMCPACGYKWFPTGDDQFRIKQQISVKCPYCGSMVKIK